MNQTVDILCRARALYASAPSHARIEDWVQPGTFCAVYALNDAAPGEQFWPAHDVLASAMDGTDCIAEWNAEHSTEEVLAAFDRAIAAEGLRVPDLQHTEQRDPVHAGQES